MTKIIRKKMQKTALKQGVQIKNNPGVVYLAEYFETAAKARDE